jgi:PAS domain-containing protein
VSSTALAPETGDEGAFVFPVTSEDTLIGVLAFSNPLIREPDDRTLQVVRSIGSHLGRFLQRLQALEALRRSESRFRALTDLTSDWYWEQNRDCRFTQVADGNPFGGADILGMTHWDLPGVVLADAAWTEHQSLLAARWSFYDFEFATVQADGQRGYYSICGEPVYDESGIFSGYRGTGLDITRRKCAEIALRESEGAEVNPDDPAFAAAVRVARRALVERALEFDRATDLRIAAAIELIGGTGQVCGLQDVEDQLSKKEDSED